MSTRAPRLYPLAHATDRAAQRRRAAALLRLVRKTDRDARVAVLNAEDRFALALWWLGAYRREALPGALWLNKVNGWPVVRDPRTLQYLTVNVKRPLGARIPLPYPRLQRTPDAVYLVQ